MKTKTEKAPAKTPARAQADSRAALAARGGKLIQARLEADAVEALEEIRRAAGFETVAEAITYALLLADPRAPRMTKRPKKAA